MRNLKCARSLLKRLEPITVYIWIPLLVNLLLIGCYFSGFALLQEIIAPVFVGVVEKHSREFGILELLQNILLICVICLLIKSVATRTQWAHKLFFMTGFLAFIFLFLEEIDYGIHYAEFICDCRLSETEVRSWHNQSHDGVQNGTKIKRANDLVVLVWFVFIPLLGLIQPVGRWLMRIPILPGKWLIATLFVGLLCSKFAHFLDDNGYGYLDGRQGSLYKNISEFREATLYYVYLLYALALVRLDRLFWSDADCPSKSDH